MSVQQYGIYRGEQLIFAGSARECAEQAGRAVSTFYTDRTLGRKFRGLHFEELEREYAVYKGEDCLVIGNIYECADFLEVKPETIEFYTMPVYARRVASVKNPEKSKRMIVTVLEPEVDDWPADIPAKPPIKTRREKAGAAV